ncbi:MAG TPA: sulfatase-like hydrolase/transferase [Thermoanaerobaculia bacterium]|jgi:arylsulfatase A-like enzyme|nr:sulfatase-like hydrolase/transferase [Thermoanaerobaculia bacterium]
MRFTSPKTVLFVAFLGLLGPADAAVPPNVILISVDTLRSDRLPAYGYNTIKTPNIDRFRADGVLFERAWSHVPLTAPAHASMLTGRLPADHGIRDNSGFALDPHIPTVASELARRGYATGAMVSTKVLASKTGLAKGFAVYDQNFTPADAAERDGEQTIAAALQWMGGQKKKSFFLFLHLYEPHTPYRKMNGVANAYDAEIVRVDTLLAKFFDELRRLRLYDSSLIVFTSDHGEGLSEHGEKQHGILLYREALQVPLIVKLPGNARRGTRITADAQLIDIAPTILQHAGVDIRGRGLPGMSLLALTPSRAIYAESFYPRFQLGWHELHSLIQGDLHLITGRRTELYDLARDPKERANLVDEQRRSAVALQRQLRAMVAPARPPSAAPIDETLLGLGYLSGGSADDTTFRPHPPDRITIFNPMLKLMTALKRKQYQDALKRADEILKAHPDYPEMWEHKARALIGLGRKSEAERAIEEGMRRSKP